MDITFDIIWTLEKGAGKISGPVGFLTNKDTNTVFPVGLNDPKAQAALRSPKRKAIIAKIIGQTSGKRGGDHRRHVEEFAAIHADEAKGKSPEEFAQHLEGKIREHGGEGTEIGEDLRAALREQAEKHGEKRPATKRTSKKKEEAEKDPSKRGGDPLPPLKERAKNGNSAEEKAPDYGLADIHELARGPLHAFHEELDKRVRQMEFREGAFQMARPMGQKEDAQGMIANGLAIHKTPKKEGKGWRITHVNSGMHLGREFGSRADAMRAVAHIDLLGADGTASQEDFIPQFREKVLNNLKDAEGYSDEKAIKSWTMEGHLNNNIKVPDFRDNNGLQKELVSRGLIPKGSPNDMREDLRAHLVTSHAIKSGSPVPAVVAKRYEDAALGHLAATQGSEQVEALNPIREAFKQAAEASVSGDVKWKPVTPVVATNLTATVKRLLPAADTTNSARNMNGVFAVKGVGGEPLVAATNGSMLAYMKMPAGGTPGLGPNASYGAGGKEVGNIPLENVGDVIKLAKDAVKASGVIDSGAVKAVASRMNAVFDKYRIPYNSRAIRMWTNDDSGDVYLSAKIGDIGFNAKVGSMVSGGSREKLEDIHLDPKHLEKVAEIAGGEAMKVGIGGWASPLVIESQDGVTQLLMPRRSPDSVKK